MKIYAKRCTGNGVKEMSETTDEHEVNMKNLFEKTTSIKRLCEKIGGAGAYAIHGDDISDNYGYYTVYCKDDKLIGVYVLVELFC